MNSRATITLILFLGWGAASTWWYTCKIKGVCLKSETEVSTIVVSDSTDSIAVTSDTTKPAAVVETLKMVTILFSSGSVQQEKNDEIDNYIKSLAAQLKSTGKKITIIGHTDHTGDEKLNDQLGLQRAESVKSNLVSLGADPANIQCISKGEHSPVASNDTEEGKRQNRRVEILFK